LVSDWPGAFVSQLTLLRTINLGYVEALLRHGFRLLSRSFRNSDTWIIDENNNLSSNLTICKTTLSRAMIPPGCHAGRGDSAPALME